MGWRDWFGFGPEGPTDEEWEDMEITPEMWQKIFDPEYQRQSALDMGRRRIDLYTTDEWRQELPPGLEMEFQQQGTIHGIDPYDLVGTTNARAIWGADAHNVGFIINALKKMASSGAAPPGAAPYQSMMSYTDFHDAFTEAKLGPYDPESPSYVSFPEGFDKRHLIGEGPGVDTNNPQWSRGSAHRYPLDMGEPDAWSEMDQFRQAGDAYAEGAEFYDTVIRGGLNPDGSPMNPDFGGLGGAPFVDETPVVETSASDETYLDDMEGSPIHDATGREDPGQRREKGVAAVPPTNYVLSNEGWDAWYGSQQRQGYDSPEEFAIGMAVASPHLVTPLTGSPNQQAQIYNDSYGYGLGEGNPKNAPYYLDPVPSAAELIQQADDDAFMNILEYGQETIPGTTPWTDNDLRGLPNPSTEDILGGEGHGLTAEQQQRMIDQVYEDDLGSVSPRFGGTQYGYGAYGGPTAPQTIPLGRDFEGSNQDDIFFGTRGGSDDGDATNDSSRRDKWVDTGLGLEPTISDINVVGDPAFINPWDVDATNNNSNEDGMATFPGFNIQDLAGDDWMGMNDQGNLAALWQNTFGVDPTELDINKLLGGQRIDNPSLYTPGAGFLFRGGDGADAIVNNEPIFNATANPWEGYTANTDWGGGADAIVSGGDGSPLHTVNPWDNKFGADAWGGGGGYSEFPSTFFGGGDTAADLAIGTTDPPGSFVENPVYMKDPIDLQVPVIDNIAHPFNPVFKPEFTPTFAPEVDFANMFQGFDPLSGLTLTPQGGASSVGNVGGGSVNFGDFGLFGKEGAFGGQPLINFGDQGMFGGNPLVGEGVGSSSINFGDYGMFGQGGLGLGELGTGLGTGLQGIGQGFGTLGTGIGELGQGLGGGLTGLGQGFGTGMAGIGTGLEGIGGGIGELGQGLGSGLGQFGQGMGTGLQGIGSGLTGLGQGFGTGMAGIGSGLEGIGIGFGTGLQGIGTGLEGIGSGLGTGLSGLGSGFGEGLTGLGSMFGQGLTGLGQGLGTGIAGLGTGLEGIGEGFGGIGEGFGQFGQGLGTGLTGLGQGFGTAMAGIGTGLEGIGGGLEGLGSGIATMNKGMFGPDAFNFGGLNTGLLGEGAIQINEGVPDWVTNPNQIFQNISPYIDQQFRSMMPGEEDFLPEYLKGGEEAFLARMIPKLFPQGDFEGALTEVLGDPLATMQAQIDEMRSGGLLGELSKLQEVDQFAPTTAEDGETAADFAISGANEFMSAPQLDMPGITDYGEALQLPLYDNLLRSLNASNPFDTRRDDILGGQTKYLDKIYNEKQKNLENRFAVMDNLGSPGFREAMKDLEEDRAMAKMGITSQFGQEAARTDESTRRGRAQDLANALSFETGRVRDEMSFQNQLQQQSDLGFANYMDQIFKSYMAPQDSYDNALRMMLGGLGTAIQPNIGAAVTGLGNNAQQYQNMIDTNNRNAQMMMNPGAFNAQGNMGPNTSPYGGGY